MTQQRIELLALFGELICYHIALVITIALRFGLEQFTYHYAIHFRPFAILFFLWLLVSYISDLYKVAVFAIHPRRYIFVILTYFCMSIMYFYLFPHFGITPKTNLIIPVLFSGILSYYWKELLRHILTRLSVFRSLVFIGGGQSTIELIKKLHSDPTLGFTVTSFFCEGDCPPVLRDYGLTVLDSMDAVMHYCQKNKVYAIVTDDQKYFRHILHSPIARHIHLYHSTSLWETINESIPPYGIEDSILLPILISNIHSSLYLQVKRFLDCLLAFMLLPFVFPVSIIVALAIRLSSKGPILYRQIRVGQYGKEFCIYKFRSMNVDAEKDGPQWSPQGDARITKLGAFLRACHLDELPQIVNVLLGDMSFIGPRPERPEFVAELSGESPLYVLRHLIRPGISGWASVRTPYGASIEEKIDHLSYDFYYVKNFSLILDTRIFFKTLLRVLSQGGR